MKPNERFWKKVKTSGENDCWEFQGGKSAHGYGVFWCNGRNIRAHRFAWIVSFGPILDGKMVCHRCDNPLCCNPAHLFIGTCKDNLDDMRKKGRACKGSEYGRSRLTDEQVVEIRKRYSEGSESYQSLASEFGVTNINIRLIVTGKIWKHLPMSPYRKPEHAKGEQIGKLKVCEVVQIKKFLQCGKKQAEISRIMKINKHTVGHIARGRCWSHVHI